MLNKTDVFGLFHVLAVNNNMTQLITTNDILYIWETVVRHG